MADLILQYLHSKDNDYCESDKILADKLNEQNGINIAYVEVAKAAFYLRKREFIEVDCTWNGLLILLSLPTQGEDLVNSGYEI